MLEKIIIPDSVTSMDIQTFNNSFLTKEIRLSENVSSLPQSMMGYCRSIESLEVPAAVTSIGNSALSNMKACKRLYLRPLIPPTLTNANAIGIADDGIIYIPYSEDHSILAAYQSANYWSTHASKMQEEAE